MAGKSKEEIAFELVSKLKGVGVWGENNMKEILNMYAECLEATSGLRTIEGRKQPSALRSNEQNSVPTAAGQAAPAQPPRAPQPPVQQQSAAQQPVHQQQQRVQQAYQQQPVQQTR